jgi:ribonucleotide reductase beta subunit family protein with ferritin-like domain
MTLTLILVASVTVNIILLLLVNYISKKRAEIMLGVWKFKEEKKIRNYAWCLEI